MTRLLVGVATGLALSTAAGTAWAQVPPRPLEPPELPELRRAPIPPRTLDPQDLQEPRRAPLTITPSLTVTQEYNDNILLDNDDRRSDFILGFTPGVTLALESSTYRLLAGYNFTAEIFFKEENEGRNDAFSRHNFDLDGTWRVNPQLTLSLTDVFAFSSDTNLLAPEGVATGREEAFSNTLAGSAAYALTRLTSLRGTASWTVLRFDDDRIDVELTDTDRPALVALGIGYWPRFRARDAIGAVPVYAMPSVVGGEMRVVSAWLRPGVTTFRPATSCPERRPASPLRF